MWKITHIGQRRTRKTKRKIPNITTVSKGEDNYAYKTEILTVSTKWFSDKANAEDILLLDKLINERASDGWELVTYDYMATSTQIKGAFVVTFRKEKA